MTMILAKCISKEQIAASKDDFIKKQIKFKEKGKHVYYPGEITKSHNECEILSCVPLNLIYDCLKYGSYIAIIECDCTPEKFYKSGIPVKNTINSSWQKTIKIMKADCKDTIDFVFNEVKNPSLISTGYLFLLSEDNQNYFKTKLRSTK
jgi:hypothetical protein